jgi:Domain of unknown function (DUF1995)
VTEPSYNLAFVVPGWARSDALGLGQEMSISAFSVPCPCRARAPEAPRVCARFRSRAVTVCSSLPSDYDVVRQEAVSATRSALEAGVPLIELQFPPIANMATAALNQLLDENRAFTREFLRPFTPQYKRERINIVFPDSKEARLAQKTWGDVPFTIQSIPKNKEHGAPSYVRSAAEPGAIGEDRGLMIVVNPGFNVSEWINMEVLQGGDPIILINGDLDKVRGVGSVCC